MKPRSILVCRMGDVAIGDRQRMRELSLGPIPWGMWGWTFHDGSTWAALAFDGEGGPLIGWAACTMQVDVLPVVGCYVAEAHRGGGTGAALITTLLRALLDSHQLWVGAAVFASTGRWSKYPSICESLGLRCLTWQ